MIYFDHAATSYPKPRCVERAVRRALTKYGGNPGRGGHALSLATAEMIYDCRLALSELLGMDAPERIVLTSGATMALNLAIYSRVRRGMHVLISDREHNATLRPILRLHREGIIEYDVFPTRGDVLASIRERIRENTGMLIACHTSNVTGFTLPVAAIGALCKERGIYFIVDAAQSAGHIPLDFEGTLCDALCAPAHKGLFGVAGLGFCALSGNDGLVPFLSGGSGVDSLSPDMPRELPERFEAGTLPTLAAAALLAGVGYVREYGIPAIAEREKQLKARVLEGLSCISGIRLYEPECQGGLVAFTHKEFSPDLLAGELDRAGICVRAGYHCAPLAHRTVGTPSGGCVRISLSHTNTERECDRFLSAIGRILK